MTERAKANTATDVMKRASQAEDPGNEERAKEEEDTSVEERADTRPELTVLVLLRDQLQKLRIAEGNRAAAAERMGDESRQLLHQEYANRLEELELSITKGVQAEVREHPAWPWLKGIRGVAETSAALVLGYIDIERAGTVSALWRYAGYAVIDGKRERPTKGEKLHYNARLKTMVWRLIDLQVKTRGPYRRIYDDAKFGYLTTRGPEGTGEWTLGHCEQAARRKAAKLFLSHLYQVWREAEGLPVTAPYIEGKGEHDIIDPYEFVHEAS